MQFISAGGQAHYFSVVCRPFGGISPPGSTAPSFPDSTSPFFSPGSVLPRMFLRYSDSASTGSHYRTLLPSSTTWPCLIPLLHISPVILQEANTPVLWQFTWYRADRWRKLRRSQQPPFHPMGYSLPPDRFQHHPRLERGKPVITRAAADLFARVNALHADSLYHLFRCPF